MTQSSAGTHRNYEQSSLPNFSSRIDMGAATSIGVNLRRFRPRLTQKTRQSGLPRRTTRAWVAMIGVPFANRGPGPALS